LLLKEFDGGARLHNDVASKLLSQLVALRYQFLIFGHECHLLFAMSLSNLRLDGNQMLFHIVAAKIEHEMLHPIAQTFYRNFSDKFGVTPSDFRTLSQKKDRENQVK